MTLRAIIIDDEQKGINSLKLVINEFINDVKVVAECSNALAAAELIESYKPDVLFLDINMPGLNGFELLEQLAWRSFSLVFVTAHSEHALKALKNNALDYLLKPIDHVELQKAVNRIRLKMQQQDNIVSIMRYASLFGEMDYNTNKGKLFVSLKNTIERLELNEIVFMESESNYTHIHMDSGSSIVAARKLREFEEHLSSEKRFMRVHHSFIINMQKVRRYLKSEEQIVMANGIKIPLAKSRRNGFYAWLNI